MKFKLKIMMKILKKKQLWTNPKKKFVSKWPLFWLKIFVNNYFQKVGSKEKMELSGY